MPNASRAASHQNELPALLRGARERGSLTFHILERSIPVLELRGESLLDDGWELRVVVLRVLLWARRQSISCDKAQEQVSPLGYTPAPAWQGKQSRRRAELRTPDLWRYVRGGEQGVDCTHGGVHSVVGLVGDTIAVP